MDLSSISLNRYLNACLSWTFYSILYIINLYLGIQGDYMAWDDIKVEIFTKFLYPGMMLKGDGFDPHGNKVVEKEVPLTSEQIQNIRNHKIEIISYSRPKMRLKKDVDKTMISEPVIENALSLLEDIHGALANNKQYIPAKHVTSVIDDLVADMERNGDAVLNLIDLEDLDDYTYTHSINVAALSIGLGASLGLDVDKQKLLGIAGLLHDIGKSMVPKEILDKPGKLDPEEWQIMQKHPIYGYNLMKSAGEFDIKVLNAVLLHHENYEDGGYPFNKPEMKTNQFSQIISVTDVFDALTSKLSYKDAKPYDEAYGIIMLNSGKKFNPKVSQIFLGEMTKKVSGEPIYPINSYVLLNTGEVAYVVDHRRSEFSLRPIVNIFINPKKEPQFMRLPQQIDLEKDNYRFIVRKVTEDKYVNHFNQRLGLNQPPQ